MNQKERRIYLIRELQHEMPQYEDLEIPDEEKGQRRLLRSMFNLRPPYPASGEFLKVQDAYLSEVIRERGIVDAAGILAEEYRETAEEVWTICALSIQNLLLTGLCLLFGRLLLKKKPGQLGFRGGLAL